MALEKYRKMRDPERTPEPFGGGDSSAVFSKSGGMFCIQKHAATRLHYDFRLAMEGVLVSWAVPKGPSLDPKEKRLAVHVEDHPIDYGDFEGVIPDDNYGAGEVILWDRGTYKVIDPPTGDAAECVRNGKLDIEMHGFKMRGAYTLVRTHLTDGKGKQENWLLIKKRDGFANDKDDLIEEHPRSILSGLTIEEMRDASVIGKKISAQLEKDGAKRIDGPLQHKNFPLTLAKPHEHAFDGDAWLFEIKYDGVRILALRDGAHVRLYARSGTEVTERYPEVTLAFDALPFDRFVIDGEIVALLEDGRPNFGKLQIRMHVSDPATARKLSFTTPAIDFVFDLLAFDGFDLRTMALEARKNLLGQIVRGEGPIRYCDHIIGHGKDFFHAVEEMGLEGIIAKRRESKYRGARSDEWLKIKAPKVRQFVIGGYTNPDGARSHFGALLLGVYEDDGGLRYVGKVGTGFDGDTLKSIDEMMRPLAIEQSPFRFGKELAMPEKRARFVEPKLVANVRFGELTQDGCVRHPSFMKLADDGIEPRDCTWQAAFGDTGNTPANTEQTAMPLEEPHPPSEGNGDQSREVAITNPDKIYWPKEGYTKSDLVDYYRGIARWMLPYLKDRPVMIVRYPDGIEGKSFYQKDAPAFAPEWIRTVTIYSHDSQRDINYFVLESEDALAYLANLGTIPIHIWSSRIGSVENPDWLLFDLDPKGSTTEKAVATARETVKLLDEIGLKAAVKTSGQMGIHVMVGLRPMYTYQQARDFSEIVARLLVARIPDLCTIERNKAVRGGKVYIDYLQLGHGKTIAAPYAVRPNPGAPVSSPVRVVELKPDLNPESFSIKNMAARMAKLKTDPFLGAIMDQQRLEPSLKLLSEKYASAGLG